MTGVQKLLILSATLFAASPLLNTVIRQSSGKSAYDDRLSSQARNASAFAQMMGEFRTSLADMLFIKTERYLDSGVAYEPHIDSRKMESSGEAVLDAQIASGKMAEAATIKPGEVASHDHSHDHDHDHDDHNHVGTIIRTANNDFRGFIGKMERQVKPWRDPSKPHQHTAGTELLPWYRLATYSDPHNVRNYMVGAWWLKSLKTPEQETEALRFLEEGISHNPTAYDLWLMKGYVLLQMGDKAAAKDAFIESVEKGIKERPPGPFQEGNPDWDMTDEEQFVAAMTLHSTLVRDLDSTASALTQVKQYQQMFPDEGALRRLETDFSHD